MLTRRELRNLGETGAEMRRIATQYRGDMAQYASCSLEQIFNVLKAIPYSPDPPDTEFLQRPYYTLSGTSPYRDCDDIAICVGAYCQNAQIPYHFLAVRTDPMEKDLHHVLTRVYIWTKVYDVDPTYSDNIFALNKSPFLDAEIIA